MGVKVKIGSKINIQVSVNDTDSQEITGKIIELMEHNKAKVEFVHPVHGWKMKKIISF